MQDGRFATQLQRFSLADFRGLFVSASEDESVLSLYPPPCSSMCVAPGSCETSATRACTAGLCAYASRPNLARCSTAVDVETHASGSIEGRCLGGLCAFARPAVNCTLTAWGPWQPALPSTGSGGSGTDAPVAIIRTRNVTLPAKYDGTCNARKDIVPCDRVPTSSGSDATGSGSGSSGDDGSNGGTASEAEAEAAMVSACAEARALAGQGAEEKSPLPDWLQTWWFYAAAGGSVFVALLILVIYLVRRCRRKRSRNNALNSIVPSGTRSRKGSGASGRRGGGTALRPSTSEAWGNMGKGKGRDKNGMVVIFDHSQDALELASVGRYSKQLFDGFGDSTTDGDLGGPDDDDLEGTYAAFGDEYGSGSSSTAYHTTTGAKASSGAYHHGQHQATSGTNAGTNVPPGGANAGTNPAADVTATSPTPTVGSNVGRRLTVRHAAGVNAPDRPASWTSDSSFESMRQSVQGSLRRTAQDMVVLGAGAARGGEVDGAVRITVDDGGNAAQVVGAALVRRYVQPRETWTYRESERK